MRYKNVFITGSAGFLGRSISNRLKKECNLIGTIRSNSENVSWTHLTHDWEEPFTHNNPLSTELFIHAAFQAPDTSEGAYKNNEKMAHHAVQAALKLKAKRVCLLSSGSIYGEHSEAITEATPLQLNNAYAKSLNEIETIFLSKLKNSELTILRLFYPYGQGQSQKRLIPRLAHKILKGEPVTIRQTSLNPMYIDDTAEAIYHIVNLSKISPILNLGGKEIISIQALATQIAKILNKKGQFVLDKSQLPAKNLFCKTNFLDTQIRCKPKFTLSDGLRETLCKNSL